MISRRSVLLAGSMGLLVAPRYGGAQSKPKIPRVGFLWFGEMDTPTNARSRLAFRERLAALGYVEGKNIVIEERSANGNAERLGELARELVASKVDVIVAQAITASRAAHQATRTIPIVMMHAGDPVGAGLIRSLPRPGGNVTGTTNFAYAGKQIGYVLDLVPRARKIAILLNPSNALAHNYVANAMEAGEQFKLSIEVVEVARAEDFPSAFAMIRDMRPDALLVMGDPMLGRHRADLFAFAASARLPASYDLPDMARQGGLIAYGPVLPEHYVMGADYVDKILKGKKPADLPVQQPDKFELVINLKTAKALGLTFPKSIQEIANERIQ